MIIGKSFKFDAAHKLPDHPKCGAIHGHTWTVTVELEGEVNVGGMVFDFGRLNTIMGEVLAKYDHKYLNSSIEHPTCEVLAASIFSTLKNVFDLKVHQVKVQEGDGGWARIGKAISN